MWNAFAGYRDIYGKSPPDRLVRRVRLYLMARNEYEYELYEQQQAEIEDMKRKGSGEDGAAGGGRKISVG